MYYPDELVEEIRNRNDIVDVINTYVRLQKKGSNHFGLCPFHSEKSPSFSVSAPKQMYHCFGCGESGNVITFIMKYENFTFQEALKMLASRAGISLPEIEYSQEARKKDAIKTRILEANKEAARFYYYQLKDETGKIGRDYFEKRKLSEETIKNYGLGFARAGRNLLYKYLKSKGFEDEILRQAGLFNFSEKDGMLDKFWNRVMFPIMDVNHRVIGFGGRVMGQGEPKYLNTSETPVFDKGRNLYGLNVARTSRKKSFIVCEGYLDVITLHQAGFTEAVASLGTALTSGHASLLRRYTDEALLAYDSDGPGVKAAIRAASVLREAGITTKVINLKPFKDPDEFINTEGYGAEEFQKRLETAENSFYFEIRMLEAEFDLNDPDGKTRFLTETAKRILRFQDDIQRDSYIEGICGKYNINIDHLKTLVGKQAAKNEGIRTYERPKSGISDNGKKADNAEIKVQKLLLSWICEEPAIYKAIKQYIEPDDFTGDYKNAASLLFEQLENNSINVAGIVACFTDETEQSEVASLFLTPHENVNEADVSKSVKQLLLQLKQNSFDRQAKESEEDAKAFTKMFESKKKLEELTKVNITIGGGNG